MMALIKGVVFIKLQDRTQFSDRDLYMLKRYWDNGMTSLGSLCKEKISAAASELSVDTEIIKVRSLGWHQFTLLFIPKLPNSVTQYKILLFLHLRK